jgi:hypothetical protein
VTRINLWLRRASLSSLIIASACTSATSITGITGPIPPSALSTRQTAFLDTLERRTFNWFWERSDPNNGLTPDRWPSNSFSSIAAVGFALTAYPVGVERGYVTRSDAAQRTLNTLRFMYNAPQGPQATNVTGYKGFFYHFLDMQTGYRFQQVELSTIDTSLLLGGILFCQSYFTGTDGTESAIRAYADSIYLRVDWAWAVHNAPVVSMGWHPESGFINSDWRGYDEGMIVYVLALGSPTHSIDPAAWNTWTSTYNWAAFYGQTHVNFAPLFGHQYSHVWIDFRGIQDAYMRGKGIDYFENSRRATVSQRLYAIDNPGQWRDYGANVWGLTAGDGPFDTTLVINGKYADNLFSTYGFLDDFNPTLVSGTSKYGRIVQGIGWFDTDYLGIDQGPIIAMIENYRSDLIWKTMRKNPYIAAGLKKAGFTGGWLGN